MDLLSDIITYVRRIIKSPSNAVITDNLIIDYINRFWINDVDARMQLFDLKTKYSFQTQPGIDRYNMPLYNVQTQPGNQTVGMYPVYQNLFSPAYINGIQVPVQTQKNSFTNIWPNIVQNAPVVAIGNGTVGPYTITLPLLPGNSTPINPPLSYILRGHVDMAGIIATGLNIDPPFGSTLNPLIPNTSIDPAFYITSLDANNNNVVVSDSGQFLEIGGVSSSYGLLMEPGPSPFGYSVLPGVYSITSNTVNYFTGVANVTFPVAIPAGVDINAQSFFFQTGLPRSILFYNNTLTLRSPPDTQYLVEMEAYLTPAAFLSTSQAIQFGYMAEYLARGSARKILSDTGDIEQFMFYEPLFKEQELLVWKRSQRIWTSSRTETIYSQGINQGQSGYNNIGGSTI